jgi:trehalose 6-phosphate phosphatase
MTDVTAQELASLDPLRPLLEHPPLALLCDIDGTLAPIVPNPEDARITRRARAALGELIGTGVKVAFVTGRALEKAREITDVAGAYIAANHGLDILIDGRVERSAEVEPYVDWAREVVREAAEVQHLPGVIVEEQGPVVAFHYRMAESEEEALTAIRFALGKSEAAQHFRVQEGRKVIELRPPLEIDKGTAVDSLVGRMGALSVLALGDDATDLDMFEAVVRLADSGMPGARIAVWSVEAPAVLMENADWFVRGVEGVEELLEGLVREVVQA